VTYVSRPRLACEGGIRINADSLVSFEATGFNQLFGSVFFEDETRSLVSRNARYFDQVGRLEADGDVELTDKGSGNVIRGQNLLYLRAVEPMRPVEELTVWGGRSQALLYPGAGREEFPPEPAGDTLAALARDTLAVLVQDTVAVPVPDTLAGPVRDTLAAPAQPPRVPYDVTADRIFLRGESYFQASGTVEVVRDSLHAFADTLRYDQQAERLLLTADARVDQDRFDLSGREILIFLPGDTIRRVEARGNGHLVGEELDLEAPFIRMAFTGGQLDALWAVPLRPEQELDVTVGVRRLPAELDSADLARPEARSTDFHVVADSLEVDAPGEVIERLFAVGTARAVSSGRDSLNTPDTPELIRQDWIEGDTVVAFFGEAPRESEADSTRYVLERLEARGEAASLYRLEPDSARSEEAEEEGEPGAEGAPPGEPPAEEPPAQEEPAAPEEAEASAVIRPGREPAVHYVIAGEIVIVFRDGQVERMEVKGLKQGIHLDPTGRRTGVAAAPGEGGS